MFNPRPLPPLQRPEQLIGTVRVGCYGGPLDGVEVQLFERMTLAHVYQDARQLLWVALDRDTRPPPTVRGDTCHPYVLLGHYAPGRNRRGGFALAWFTDFGGACRASLRPHPSIGVPAFPPPPLPPGVPFTLPPGVSVSSPGELTAAELATADHAEGERLAQLCKRFLMRPPSSVRVELAVTMLAACARWLGEVTAGGLTQADRLRLERHAERFERDPYVAHVAARILDALSTWESIHGDPDDETHC